ncbi:hypothetical protein ACFLRB_02765 [Acidobacteriota bacterium]
MKRKMVITLFVMLLSVSVFQSKVKAGCFWTMVTPEKVEAFWIEGILTIKASGEAIQVQDKRITISQPQTDPPVYLVEVCEATTGSQKSPYTVAAQFVVSECPKEIIIKTRIGNKKYPVRCEVKDAGE